MICFYLFGRLCLVNQVEKTKWVVLQAFQLSINDEYWFQWCQFDEVKIIDDDYHFLYTDIAWFRLQSFNIYPYYGDYIHAYIVIK
jgi:hypothetical protein